MKRINNLYPEICSIANLELADKIARRGKGLQEGVIRHIKNEHQNIWKLHLMLVTKTFKTSQYTSFEIRDPKVRTVYSLPYFPDRIAHHAIMNVLEPVFVSTFTKDTYSCIKDRGIHAAANNVKQALRNDVPGTQFCLKLDIKKFYPSIDHQVLKNLLRRKIKDQDLLWLLDEIIESVPSGVPIGNYLSQYFANFYLSYFDHWIKEEKGVKHYFRYADDLVILSESKAALHKLLWEITEYLQVNLKLKVKGNYQVFPVAERGIDFVGYVFFHTHTLLRKSIKQNFARMLKGRCNNASIAAYNGWLVHANTKNLRRKLICETSPNLILNQKQKAS
jgi:RNA-directed DNA polymerase